MRFEMMDINILVEVRGRRCSFEKLELVVIVKRKKRGTPGYSSSAIYMLNFRGSLVVVCRAAVVP
jgi:hypothetical protein